MKEPSSPALSKLRVAKTYAPHQDGAKRFARRYGDTLVCVRHRLSADGLMRHTTVELVMEVTPVAPRRRQMIALQMPPTDRRSRALLMGCGAIWDAKARLWIVPHLVAKNLGLLRYRVRQRG